MSLVQSISIDSSSSIDTMSTIPSTDITQNLYENRDHFQAIFTNDSRFFDTSLHLFKSYASMGYISSNGIKTKTQLLSPLTGGHRHRWRTRLLGPRHHEHHPIDTLKALLTPTLLRKQDRSPSMASTTGYSSQEIFSHSQQFSSPAPTKYTSIPAIVLPDPDAEHSDESEVTITRL